VKDFLAAVSAYAGASASGTRCFVGLCDDMLVRYRSSLEDQVILRAYCADVP
jgi:hypothetical protein